tara:strand:+ start:219 stop:383 length:165 start_codon:yes stop_codon:yes gene_type:complete
MALKSDIMEKRLKNIKERKQTLSTFVSTQPNTFNPKCCSLPFSDEYELNRVGKY